MGRSILDPNKINGSRLINPYYSRVTKKYTTITVVPAHHNRGNGHCQNITVKDN